jgi:hypothetical protein
MATEELGEKGRISILRTFAQKYLPDARFGYTSQNVDNSRGTEFYLTIEKAGVFGPPTRRVVSGDWGSRGLDTGWKDLRLDVHDGTRADDVKAFASAYEEVSGKTVTIVIQF